MKQMESNLRINLFLICLYLRFQFIIFCQTVGCDFRVFIIMNLAYSFNKLFLKNSSILFAQTLITEVILV